MKWLPWIGSAIVALLLLSHYSRGSDAAKQAADGAKAAASANPSENARAWKP